MQDSLFLSLHLFLVLYKFLTCVTINLTLKVLEAKVEVLTWEDVLFSTNNQKNISYCSQYNQEKIKVWVDWNKIHYEVCGVIKIGMQSFEENSTNIQLLYFYFKGIYI